MPRNHALLAAAAAFATFTAASTFAFVVPTDVQLPGTQPSQAMVFGSVQACSNCHANYDPVAEPGHLWQGSMMSHAGRDPLFWGALAVTERAYPGAGDFCLRCHTPRGWLEGRSTNSDGSSLSQTLDHNGIECSICHSMTNPNGQEHPGVMTPPFVANNGATPAQGYHGSGMLSMSGTGVRYGPYASTTAQHAYAASQFHRSPELCGSCHDVSNPLVGDLAHNHGAQVPLAPGTFSGVPNSPVTGKAAFLNFPHQYGVVERTYSEHKASGIATTLISNYNQLPADLQRGAIAYARNQAMLAGTNGNYADGTPRAFTCQSCHMAPVVGAGSLVPGSPLRTDLPQHDLTGGNTTVPDMIRWLDSQNRLQLGGGITPAQSAAMDAGIVRARASLRRAAVLDMNGNTVRVTNLTGHKLITGYPEGRRMWLRTRWRDEQGNLLRDDGAYGTLQCNLWGQPYTVETLLDANARTYHAVHGMTQEWAAQLVQFGVPATLPLMFDRQNGTTTLTLGQLAALPAGSARETFHFILNNVVLSDTRIPPYGYRYDEARTRNALPVPATQYGNPGTGGTYEHFDVVPLNPPPGATRADVELLYQTTSWEYIEFLYLANNGSVPNLALTGLDVFDAWRNTGMSPPEVMASARWCDLPGTGEDLRLRTGVDAAPDGNCGKLAGAGQTVTIELTSPNQTFTGRFAVLALEVHTENNAPVPPLPNVHLDRLDWQLTFAALPASGVTLQVVVPPGVAGLLGRIQGAVIAPIAQNNLYAASNAHDIVLR